ncbi:hypothetical protein [Actinoplanes sp. URMC 104]|uniref:hypothetical protein n=1 Tax=Actinoplanes sp. URMC 104 TaxID=3423409 RepID=UPI003F1AF2A2
MPSQTTDLEAAISADLTTEGALSLDTLVKRYGGPTDPRWVGVALAHLHRDGTIRWISCDAAHNHDGNCAIELAPR